jgi:hypothetical protein
LLWGGGYDDFLFSAVRFAVLTCFRAADMEKKKNSGARKRFSRAPEKK